MSPQQAIRNVTGLDLKALATLASLGAIVVGATAYIVNNSTGANALQRDFQRFEKNVDARLDGLGDTIQGQVAEMNARFLTHESSPQHNGANVRLTVLEHRSNQQDQAFKTLNEKLDRILRTVGGAVP